jgi:3-dehydroquinate synthase
MVGLQENKYDILIENGLLDSLGGLLRPFLAPGGPGGPVAVVTDENVWKLYGERFASSLSGAGVTFLQTVLPEGERNKSLDGLSCLYDAFAGARLTRDGLIVAFGGGVVGDLCGFAAATWMRGVRFVQVPTTLLAQVDSSVGGKTAINLPQGKNLAGAFYQPKLAVIDPLTLRTLPEREIRSGMAEVIKYGAIRSATLFKALGEHAGTGDPADVICECCGIKSGIVERDERDMGERMLLNFGHTFGHAIEKKSGFGKYRHGEAVAFGMTIAAAIGEETGATAPGVTDALRRVSALHGLDTDYPGDVSELLHVLPSDKKNLAGGVRMILLRDIGDAFTRLMPLDDVGGALRKAANRWRA